MADTLQTQPLDASKKRSRKRRRWAIFAWTLVIICVIFLLLTHSPLTARFVLPRLSALVGAKVTAEGVRIRPDGVVILNRPKFTLESPGLSGPAATLAEAKSAEGKLAFWSVLRGKVVIDKLVLVEPVVRVSQDVDAGTLNLGALNFDRGTGVGPDGTQVGRSIGEVPLIVVERGAIELGEHNKDGYTLLKRLSLNGTIEPALGPEGGFRILLQQSRDGTIAVGSNLNVQGRVSSTGLTISMQGFELSDWPPTVMPVAIRAQFDSLDLDGQIKQADLHYDFVGIPTASLDLENVRVSLPAGEGAGDATDGTGAPRLQMTQTNGRIELDRAGLRANIHGMLEDVPYRATLKFEGTDPNGPFNLELASDGYTVGKNPAFKQFVNETVKERLRDFGEPTGQVTTTAIIRRGPLIDGKPGPVETKGLVKLTKGTAAFHKFPYPWANLDAEIEFSDTEIKIKRLTGNNPDTGAVIHATGVIGPLNDEAGVSLDITADQMPMDDVLYAAMKPGEREGIKAIFAPEEIARLEKLELIATPANTAALLAKKLDAEKLGNTPEVQRLTNVLENRKFSPRGVCSITVTLRRPIGLNKDWDQDIRVRAPGAGVVSEAFPLPMKAGDFELRIGNDDVEITGKNMTALSGGTADLQVHMTLAELRNGGDVVPRVEVETKDLAIDELVMQAARHSIKRFAGASSERIARMVSDMHLTGTTSGRVSVTPDPNRAGSANLSLALAGLAGTPHSKETIATMSMRDTRLALETRRDLFQLNAEGELVSGTGTMPFAVRAESSAWKNATLADRSAIDIDAKVAGLSLALDAAPLLSVFSIPAAAKVDAAQRSLKCVGTADVLTNIQVTGAGDLATAKIDFESVRDLSLTLMETRLTMKEISGGLSIEAGEKIEGAKVNLDQFKARLLDGAAEATAAELTCSGTVTVSDTPQDANAESGGVAVKSGDMQISLSHAAYESPTLRSIAVAAAPSTLNLVRDWDPKGQFDMILHWKPGTAQTIQASMSPKTLDVQRADKRVVFSNMSGTFDFSNTQGVFQGLTGSGSSWTTKVDGGVQFPGEGEDAAAVFDTTISLTSQGLPEDLTAAMPAAVSRVLKQLTLEFPSPGTLELQNTRVQYTIGEKSESVDASGKVLFSGASLKAGVDITGATGDLVFKTAKAAENLPATFEIDAAIASATVAEVAVTKARVSAFNGAQDGDVLIPHMSGKCHGGLLSASAVLLAKGENQKDYDLQVRLSGVNFAPVVDDLKKSAEHAASNDVSRGVLDASLSLAGTVDDSKSRRGRLFATVGGGEIAKFPGLVAMARLSNLQLPMSEPLDLARTSALVDGDRVLFDEITVSSESVSMIGYGTMEWPSTELDLRFNSRANWRIPLVNWAIEKLRNELITTRVRGTVKDPKVDTVTLPGTSSVLNQLSGRATEQDNRMKKMKEQLERGVK